MVCLQQSLLQGVFPQYLYPGDFSLRFVFCSILYTIWNELSWASFYSFTCICVILIINLCSTGGKEFVRLINEIMKKLLIQMRK